MKIPSSNLGRTCCVHVLTFRTIFVHNMFSPSSAKRRASDKDLPVQIFWQYRGFQMRRDPLILLRSELRIQTLSKQLKVYKKMLFQKKKRWQIVVWVSTNFYNLWHFFTFCKFNRNYLCKVLHTYIYLQIRL